MIKSEILKSHSSIPHTDEVIIGCEDGPFQKTRQNTRILGPEEAKQLAQNQVLISDFKQQKLEKEAQKNWDLFYKRNSTNFFKDRHWTTREFEELKACRKFEDQKLTILEAGCGVGNCLFPLLEDLNMFAYACDFSPRAVEYVKQNPLYDAKRCKVFLCDLTKDDLSENVPLESVDVVMLIFVLSAIHPEKMHLVLNNIYKILKPGKYVLFRDYGLHDHAMLRFKSACKLGENFYVRQDGTRSYFFSDEFLAELFLSVGYEEIVNEYVFRETLNKKENGELEKLNQSTDDINRREMELEDARQKFRSILVEATVKLDELVKKIGKSVEDSKPYWEARRVARQAQLEAQKATQDFQRATEVLRAAKETISLAEQRLLEDDKRQFDSAWQEMLNHATQRVMEAEQTKTRSELVHKETAAKYNVAMGRMKQLEKKLKWAINKSKPYFELKAKYYVQLEQLKKIVDDLQAKLALAKGEYKTALKNLEMISDEIHERRRVSSMGPRGCGVGAEGNSASAEDLSTCKLDSDNISIASEVFEDDNCSTFVSEEDSETQSLSSFSSGPTSPFDIPAQFLPVTRPKSLDLSSPISLSEFGAFPLLGPRSECSGASSPECEIERGDRAEGAENKILDRVNKNKSVGSSSSSSGPVLDNRLKQLSLQCLKIKNGVCADKQIVQIG